MDEGGEQPRRILLAALAAMAAVAVLVGAVVAVGLVMLAHAVGLSGSSNGQADAPLSMYIPPYQPTTTAPEPVTGSPTRRARTATPSASETAQPIALKVAPQNVGPGQQIFLTGSYPGGDGHTLQVQRRENGSWSDFPVVAKVTGGRFSTWIQTSRLGKNRFRLFDSAKGQASNTVVVTIR